MISTNKRGFTIVELFLVITVIAILVVITAVSYRLFQERARDGIRRQHAQQISDALRVYGSDHGYLVGPGSGCGANGNGGGWFNSGGPHDPQKNTSSYYPRSILDCLLDEGLLDPTFIDPKNVSAFASSRSGEDGSYAYMKYNCGYTAYILMRMETVSDSERMDPADIACTNARNGYNSYGMNYYLRVDL